MNQDSSKKMVFGILAIVLFLFAGYLIYSSWLKQPEAPTADKVVSVSPTVSIPTRTPEERKIIEAVKDYTIEISSNSFSPAEITVKAYDQVFWENKDQASHKVFGEGWGGLSIKTDGRYMHSFKEPGTYSYYLDSEDGAKGTVTVE